MNRRSGGLWSAISKRFRFGIPKRSKGGGWPRVRNQGKQNEGLKASSPVIIRVLSLIFIIVLGWGAISIFFFLRRYVRALHF